MSGVGINQGLRIRIAQSNQDVEACFPLLVQLIPDLCCDTFVQKIRTQYAEGYKLVMLEVGSSVVCVAGVKVWECLSWDKIMFVDDLVTDKNHRSKGFGSIMLRWLQEWARNEGCREIHLDSGVQRHRAHEFYFRNGFKHICNHFSCSLRGVENDTRPSPSGQSRP